MTSPDCPLQNQDAVKARFSKAASNYESHARIQKRVADTLWDWTTEQLPEDFSPMACLDVGCGTGFLTRKLLENFSGEVHAIDLAPGMLEWLKQHLNSPRLKTHLMDGEKLALEKLWVPRHSLIISSMCVQWFENLTLALQRWVSTSNTVAFSVLLDGSFDAWYHAHHETGQLPGLQVLPCEDQLRAAIELLQSQGVIQNHAFKTQEFLDHHFDGLSFARSLRAIGADSPRKNHQPVNLHAVIRELGTGCTINYRVGFVLLERV